MPRTRNYNTTLHTVYPRVSTLVIQYPENGVAKADYLERDAIVDSSGLVRHLDGGGTQVPLQFDALPDAVPCVNPATGEVIPGMTVTKQQLMLGVLAFIRADQLRRDAESDQ
jgi:hypothetical protein